MIVIYKHTFSILWSPRISSLQTILETAADVNPDQWWPSPDLCNNSVVYIEWFFSIKKVQNLKEKRK